MVPANILTLPDFKVQWVDEADHDYNAYEEVPNHPAVCTACASDRLARWIGQQSLKCTFASIAADTGLDEKTIRNSCHDSINDLDAEFRFGTPKWMGSDEIHLIEPRRVISSICNNNIVNIFKNRDAKTVTTSSSTCKGVGGSVRGDGHVEAVPRCRPENVRFRLIEYAIHRSRIEITSFVVDTSSGSFYLAMTT